MEENVVGESTGGEKEKQMSGGEQRFWISLVSSKGDLWCPHTPCRNMGLGGGEWKEQGVQHQK